MKQKIVLIGFVVIFLVMIAKQVESKKFKALPDCKGGILACTPSQWHAVSRPKPEQTTEIIFALKQRNLQKLENFVEQVSSPKSKTYGKYLTMEEVYEMTGDKISEEGLKNWLHKNDFHSIVSHPHSGFISCTGSVGRIDELFHTKLLNFAALTGSKRVLRTTEYSLPLEIEQFVDFVYGLIDFPVQSSINPIVVAFDDDENHMEIEEITPTLLNDYYNIGFDQSSVKDSRATQSLFEALDQSYSPKDLATFQDRFGLHHNDIVKVIGRNFPEKCADNPRDCAEGQLDVEYIMIAQDSPTTYWSVDGTGADIFVKWIIAVGEDSNPPLVHSVSYGGPERLFPLELVHRADVEFQKMAARGLTIVVASGDDGVAGSQARGNSLMCRYSPSYPASLPHVLSVGATQGPEANKTEIACSSETGGLITSGGGFSTVFDRPEFQDKYVAQYFKNVEPKPAKGYNTEGRGFPDLSVAGRNYAVCIGNRWYAISGTSASAPVVAAMLTLINGERLKQGKSSLGWVTPALYSFGSNSNSFRDIQTGRNNCCAGHNSPVCCEEGFSAATGWDPVTGFGSIDFQSLCNTLANI